MLRPILIALSLVALLAGCARGPSNLAPAAGASAARPGAVLTGTVTYLARIALPPDAEVTVTLSDVSQADIAAPVLGTTTFRTEGKQVPLAWEIAYDPARIGERTACSVAARITVGGELAWISDVQTPVLTLGAPRDAIEIQLNAVNKP